MSTAATSAVAAMSTAAAVTPHHYDTIVVGAGLSGTHFAVTSQSNNNNNIKVLEASDRFGGRLYNAPNTHIDMGAAWVWPRYQPKMNALIQQRLKLKLIRQAYSMDMDAYRIQGGAVQLVESLLLSSSSNDDLIQYNSFVTKCTLKNNKVVQLEYTNTETNTMHTITADAVVFAIPPRMLQHSITFEPSLSQRKRTAIAHCPTWMAGVTKVTLIYSNPFWSKYRYALERIGAIENGPAFQMYDASYSVAVDGNDDDGDDNSKEKKTRDVHAVTMFTLADTSNMGDEAAAAKSKLLVDQVIQQWIKVLNLTGNSECAKEVLSIVDSAVQYWPLEKYISDDPSPTNIQPHPHPIAALAEPEWDDKLFFAGTETDQSSPGVMEGAIGASERVMKQLMKVRKMAASHRDDDDIKQAKNEQKL